MSTDISVCVFDAYGTLFDVHAAVARHASRLGKDAGTVPALWHSKQQEYTWLCSLMGRHRDFMQVTADALNYALKMHGIDDEALHEDLLGAYLVLDCYDEAPMVLGTLKDAGMKTAILSNATPAMLESAMRHSGITDLVDAALSVEDAGFYKPDPRAYQLAARRFGVDAAAVSFLSANAWDAAGADAFGYKAAWINRSDQKPERIHGIIRYGLRSLHDALWFVGLDAQRNALNRRLLSIYAKILEDRDGTPREYDDEEEGFLDAIYDAIAGGAIDAIAERLTGPVIKAAIADPDRLINRLAEIYTAIDAEALQNALARLMFIADLGWVIPAISSADIGHALNLSAADAVAFFRRKGFPITHDWREVWRAVDAGSLSAAKKARHDLLVNLREIIDRKIADGLTERQTAEALEDELIKAGWLGRLTMTDANGDAVLAQLGTAWRVRAILQNSILIEYAAAHYRRQTACADSYPWWQYIAGATCRSHRALHEKILHHADPLWRTIYPPNGPNCRCRVVALNNYQLRHRDKDKRIYSTSTEQFVWDDERNHVRAYYTESSGLWRHISMDPMWACVPSQSNVAVAVAGRRPAQSVRIVKNQPGWKAYKRPRRIRGVEDGPRPLAAAVTASPADATAALRSTLGITARGARVINTVLDGVVISDNMLQHIAASEDRLRVRYANRVLPTLKNPDEIWITQYDNDEFRKHYIKIWKDKAFLVVVADIVTETDGRILLFYNFIPQKRGINKKRIGALFYPAPET